MTFSMINQCGSTRGTGPAIATAHPVSPYGHLAVVGLVSAIESTFVEVTDLAGDAVSFVISPVTTVRKDGAAAQVTDLCVGLRVAVTVSDPRAPLARTIVVVPSSDAALGPAEGWSAAIALRDRAAVAGRRSKHLDRGDAPWRAVRRSMTLVGPTGR